MTMRSVYNNEINFNKNRKYLTSRQKIRQQTDINYSTLDSGDKRNDEMRLSYLLAIPVCPLQASEQMTGPGET